MQKVHLIGNAHLDPVWLWQWQEGFAEIKATFRSALDRMKEYDDFIFTSACAAYYMWIEKVDPEMFAEIKARVKEGRWCIVGGWFIQPDCNIPSGEAFARHALISQRYFKEKFDVMAETGYNVDSFGHNGNLPMILQNSRMKNYVFMRPMANEKNIKQSLFVWESRDGSRVMTYRIPFTYHVRDESLDLFEKIADMNEGLDEMAFYGVGNHGGGPTVELLDWMHEHLDERFVYSDPNAYFAAQEGKNLPILRDDLQYHAKGCYSAFGEVKAANRQAENALVRAEKFSVLSNQLIGTAYPAADLDRAWKNVLFNQFHDILGGCSIREAFDDARYVHGQALAIASDVENFALQKLSWNINTLGNHKVGSAISEALAEKIGTPIVVFNPHPYEVHGTAHQRLFRHDSICSVTDKDGKQLPIQCVRDSKTNRWKKYARLFEVTVPAFGYSVYYLHKRKDDTPTPNPFLVTDHSIANEKLRLTFDPKTGDLIEIYDVEKGKNLLSGYSRVALYDDAKYDTWAHTVDRFKDEIPYEVKGLLTLTEQGPVRATIRSVQTIGDSTVTRDYSLHRDCDTVQVKTKIDFREKHRILKFEYPLTCRDPKALCKIPFGAIERPTDGTEQVCGDWIALSDEAGGIGIATDSKHSFDADGSKLSFTVLRSSIYADHFGQEYRDEFCEFTEQGIQRFSYCIFPYTNDADAERRASELQNPLVAVPETFHGGSLPLAYSGMNLSAPNVIVTAIKQHVSGEGIVLRCYEAQDKDTDVKVDLLGNTFEFHIPHSAVKTYWLKDGTATETDFIE